MNSPIIIPQSTNVVLAEHERPGVETARVAGGHELAEIDLTAFARQLLNELDLRVFQNELTIRENLGMREVLCKSH